MLDTYADVEHVLRRFADAYQPRTGSALHAGGTRSTYRFPFRPALLDDLETRSELQTRMSWLDARERAVLVGWYAEGRDARTLARALHFSARHVHRVRSRAIERIAEFGRADAFADADLAEFA